MKRFATFLAREAADAPVAAIVTTTAISGVAAGLLLVLVNTGAEQVANGEAWLLPALAFLAAFGLLLLARSFALNRSAAMVEAAIQRVRLRIIDKVRRSDLRALEQYGGLGTYAPLTQDLGLISQAVVFLVPVLESLTLLGFVALYLAWLSPVSLIAVLLVYLILLPLYFGRFRQVRVRRADAARLDAAFFERFASLLAGFKELKLNRAENEALFAHLAEITDGAFRHRLAAAERHAGLVLSSSASQYAILLLVVFVLPVLLPEAGTTIHKVVATVLYMMAPLEQLVGGTPILTRADAAVGNLRELEARLDAAQPDADHAVPPAALGGFGQITLDGVSFHYKEKGGEPLFSLGPLDLILRAGETLFIVGGNGSGKSTLLKLLSGLYRPERGRILLDGREVLPEERARYRTLFTSVFTDFHLFERFYARPDIHPDRVNAKLAELGLTGKTRYGAAGFGNLNLSTGQKKRLAFAAAMLKQRPVLVLDELAADQDPWFRRRYYEEILPRLKTAGHTLLVVSNDEQYFHTADRVLQMRDGRIWDTSDAAKRTDAAVGGAEQRATPHRGT